MSFAKVATIHDMVDHHQEYVGAQTMEEGREKFQRRIFAYGTSAVIVPTTFVRDEVLAQAPSIADRVFVVPHGVDHRTVPAKKPPSPFPYPYFLFVSTLDKRKNAVGAVSAFSRFAETHPNVRLVLIGMDGTAADDLRQRVADLAVRERIVVPGFVRADMLAAAYMNAAGLFFPSFYEGFGFPILEAMRFGCPVITSRIGAMQELAGDAALLTDPRNEAHMAEALRFIFEDSGLRSNLIERGKLRSAEFTWEKCTEQTLRVYQRAVEIWKKDRARK
jgi:glycosyltransferase involved in cell wall biosynthesis